jgi:NAD(P)-dependent dehydrogenase (short-subunit alcohol dehydrogenase family)
MAKPLAQHVAVISGGLGDIGRAIALELARRGADIAVGDIRSPGDAGALLDQLKELGARGRYDRVDVSQPDEVTDWISEVERSFGVVNLIIPNAAIVTASPVMKMLHEAWTRELQVNLTGAFHLARTGAARLLDQQRPGRIVFTGSWAADAPHPQITAYCVAKAGLRMLCKCMALELAPHGILVNEVAPGYVDAGLSAGVWKSNPQARANAQARVPINQLIAAEDVALQIAHLCDPANRHMTGSTLLMDGGLSLVTPAAKR